MVQNLIQMKKLLFLAFLFLLFSKQVTGQEKTSANSLSIIVAPNMFFQFSPIAKFRAGYYDPGFGHTVGADFNRRISQNWHYKIGARYNIWKSSITTGPFVYPSELISGEYDPTLQHYFTNKYTDQSLQLLGAFGWNSKPGKWCWNADMELGLTTFPTRPRAGRI